MVLVSLRLCFLEVLGAKCSAVPEEIGKDAQWCPCCPAPPESSCVLLAVSPISPSSLGICLLEGLRALWGRMKCSARPPRSS